MLHTYTVHKVSLDGQLSHKEHLDNFEELNTWMANKYGKFVNVQVRCDQTNKVNTYTDNGSWWEKVSSVVVTQ